LIIKPFEKTKDNLINIFNEIAITMTFVLVLIMNNIELPEVLVNIMQWILIVPLIISLISTWIIIFPDILEGLKKSLKELFKKKTANNKDERINTTKRTKERRLNSLNLPEVLD